MSSVTTTSLLLPSYTGNFLANVIGAQATETTFVLDCDFEKDNDDCGLTKNTVIVGPWADKTLASDAVPTGLYSEYVTMEDFTFSIRCDMSRTYAETCTTINLGGNDNGSPTATFPRTASDTDLFEDFGYDSFTWVPVTITAGYDLLSNREISSAKATSTKTISAIEDNGATQSGISITETARTVTSTSAGTHVEITQTVVSVSAIAPIENSGSGASAARALIALAVAGVVSITAVS